MRSFSLAHLTLFTCANLLYSSAGVMANTEKLLNDFVQFGKEFLEKVLTQWRLPQLVNNGNGQLSFQLDPTNNLEMPCVSCRFGVPRETLPGTWSIIMISQNLMSSKFAELDRVLARLERNQPVSTQKTFMEWISGAPDLRCAQITVLDSVGIAKYEIGYRLAATGRQRSVIGNWNRDYTGTYTWELPAQIGAIRLCISHHGYLESDALSLNRPQTVIWPVEANVQGFLPSNSIPINTTKIEQIDTNPRIALTTKLPPQQITNQVVSELAKQQIGQHVTEKYMTLETAQTTQTTSSDRSITDPSSHLEINGKFENKSISTNSCQSVSVSESENEKKIESSTGISAIPNLTLNVTSCSEVTEKNKTIRYGKIVGVGTVTEVEPDRNSQIPKNILDTVLNQKTILPDTVGTVRNVKNGEENATVRLSSEITKMRLRSHRKCANRTKGSRQRKQRMALPLSQPLASPLPILPAVRWPSSQPLEQPQNQLSIDGLSRNMVAAAAGSELLASQILPESLASAGPNPAVAMTQFLVLNQVDSSPMPCDNYIVLARFTTPRDSDQTLAKIAQIREFLERERIESVFNKLERIHCY